MRKFVLAIMIAIGLAACEQESLRDTSTKEEVAKTVTTEGQIQFKHMSDNMVRKNKEFAGSNVVVDSNYYKDNAVKRGDIV